MSLNLRQKAKLAIFPLGSLVPASRYLDRSIRSWPGVTALLYDIKVPRRENHTGANIKILLDLLDQTEAVAGDVAECGVFRGRTLVPMALYLAERGSRKHVFGFDSFEGFDDAVAVDIGLGGARSKDKHVGAFNETSVRLVESKLQRFGLRNVTLVKGYFRETLQGHQQFKFSLVHLDCDIFESYKECLEFFYPRMSRGGVLLFDEYRDPRWPGCTKAVDEYLVDKPEKPVRIVRDRQDKFYVRKVA